MDSKARYSVIESLKQVSDTFAFFSIKTYVAGTHKKHIGFHGGLSEIIFQLSSNTNLIYSPENKSVIISIICFKHIMMLDYHQSFYRKVVASKQDDESLSYIPLHIPQCYKT